MVFHFVYPFFHPPAYSSRTVDPHRIKNKRSVRFIFFVACFLSLCFFANHAYGLDAKIHITKYSIKNGLSDNNVRNVLQDPFGYMWISTADGLNRFDGKRSSKYDNSLSIKNKTLSPDIRATCFDTAGGFLYVLNSVEGLSVIDPITGHVVRFITTKEKTEESWNITMTIAAQKLWIGSGHGLKIYNIKKNTWETISFSFPVNRNGDLFTIRTLYADSQHRIWVFIENYGLVLLDAQKNSVIQMIPLTRFCKNSNCVELAFTSIVELTNELFLVGTSDGLKKVTLSDHSFLIDHHPLVKTNLPDEPVISIAKAGGTVFVKLTSGLYKVDMHSNYSVHLTDGVVPGKSWLNTIHYLYVDRDENLWAACEQGLTFIKNNNSSPFEKISNEEFPDANFNMVYQVKPIGDLYLIGMKYGLLTYNPRTHAFNYLEKKKRCNFFFQDFNSWQILSMSGGLSVLKKGKLIPIADVYPEWKPYATVEINSVASLGDSIYLIGSENARGIYLWNFRKKEIRVINSSSSSYHFSLRSNIINTIRMDQTGNIWILSDMGIDIIRKNWNYILHLHFTDKTKRGGPILFFDMCETRDHYWINSYGMGLIRLDKNLKSAKAYTAKQGLSRSGVYKLFNYKDSILLLTTNNGLSVFDIKHSSFHSFFEEDGIHSNTFEENSGMEYNGKFIAGGLNGFTIIDPSLIKINVTPPKLHIDRIELESRYETKDTYNLLLQQLDIPSDVIRVGLRLSTINFGNPTRTRSAYRINESKDWIFNEDEDQDIIQLIGISPGAHSIQVKSANEHNYWNGKPITIKLNFLPKWYQSIWFRVLVLLIIISGIIALYSFRLHQIKKQHAIRKNIASDLHDDLGSSLNTVKIFAHMAKRETNNNSYYLDEIESALTDASISMRDMIWVLDDTNDTWRELIERIKKFALPLLSTQQIELNVSVDDTIELHTISKEEKKHILFITKEAINNSVKYSNCKEISIHLQKIHDKVMFTVTDNGAGFDTSLRTEGHGLKNIKYRAGLIRYKMVYTSQVGKGTEICLKKE